jgi:AraC-like DNA-binding protein
MSAATSHTVAMPFVRSAVCAVSPARRDALLAGCGIAPALLVEAQARVPAAAFGALWLAVARELNDEFFGLDARRMKPGSFALLCHGLLGHATVERALQQAARGFALFLDDLSVELQAIGPDLARVVLHNRIDVDQATSDARRFADETMLVMMLGLLCWLAGRRVPLVGLALAHPRPDHAAEYARMFCSRMRFDAPDTSFDFDARVLRARPAPDAAGLKVFLRDAPQSVFLKQVAAGSLAERARRRLRAAPPWPTLDALAAQWGMSPATLRRRLQQEGSGWAGLKDEVRRDQAIHLLAVGTLPLPAIAERLGFDDASSFHRAFRRWTGTAPGAYRARGTGAADP